MSWQQYVDSNLVGTGHVSKAAIYGLNGGQWAVSPGFSVSHLLMYLSRLTLSSTLLNSQPLLSLAFFQ